MQMSSGIRLGEEKAKELLKNPAQLKGQAEIQAYLQYSDPIPAMPRQFKYQEPDTAIAMQVLNAVAPGRAEEFIKTDLIGRMGITQYQWESAISALPKSAAGSSLLSRDMMKFGQLILNKGRRHEHQLIPKAYIARATSPNVHSYGTPLSKQGIPRAEEGPARRSSGMLCTQLHGECRAFSRIARGLDAAAVGLHDGFADRETEAGAAGSAVARIVGAVEAVEDVGQVFRGDAGAGVGDGKDSA